MLDTFVGGPFIYRKIIMRDIIKYNKKWELHGEYKSYYTNGQLWGEGLYEKGLPVGLWIYYYENSKVRYKGYFENDKPIGFWKHYYNL